ncbi:MAG TPA: folate family ECF transporter S component [Clostridia bacterium]|nr:folate family ECF transporter S component [Clostridia bacterium]
MSRENVSPIQKVITRNKLSTRTLALAAIFAAMNIILTRAGVIMLFGGIVRLSFGKIPLILSGLLLGPFAGGLAGLVGDIIGVIINSHGAPMIHPGFTLSSVLTGAIPGTIVILSGKKRSSLFNVVTSNIVVLILVNFILDAIWLSQMYGNPYLAVFYTRLVPHIIIGIVNVLLTYPLLKSLVKAGLASDTIESSKTSI